MRAESIIKSIPIGNFPLLSTRTKKDMITYLEDFYKTIDNKRSVRSVFIANARRS